jgi:hypothetical protein
MLRIQRTSLLMLGILLLCLSFTQKVSAQTDLDRLYIKYKGQTETTIFVGEREINARVIIYGEAAADTDMENLVEELGNTKTKAGYRKLLHPNAVNFDQNRVYENNIQVSVYQKGTQYAQYGIKKMDERNQLVGETGTPHYTDDFFYFEVGDTARRSTLKPEKFDF